MKTLKTLPLLRHVFILTLMFAACLPSLAQASSSGIDTPSGVQQLPLAVEGTPVLTLKPAQAELAGDLQTSGDVVLQKLHAQCPSGGTIGIDENGKLVCKSSGGIDYKNCVTITHTDGFAAGMACGATTVNGPAGDCSAYPGYVMISSTTGIRYPSHCVAAVVTCCKLN